jgi:DNA-binding CsgD family transcriptional regulator
MFEFLLEELVGGAPGIQERTEGIAFFKVAKSVYPISTISYIGLNIPISAQSGRYMQCTYSDLWVKQCVSQGTLSVTRPATLTLILRTPLDWSDLPETPDTEKLFEYAKSLKRSRQVLSFPLRDLAGETAIFCVGAEISSADWCAQKKGMIRELQVLGSYFHQHMLRIYGCDTTNDILISARELDCLKWMAAGKTAWEASVILGISERTVRFHLNTVREKLNCSTTTQAVAKAVSHQLI